MVQMVKNLPAMRETWVWSLGQEDALEKEMTTHFSILPGEPHGQRSLAGYSPWSRKESDTTEQVTHTHIMENNLKRIYICFPVVKNPPVNIQET